ncbi:gliding motility lipoprotein GldH [Microscilla marina]|uniref:gliding motility lipoprotein GldH n=1 Tax=Microscilla marina TaxID=1027 RepID=UPI0012F92988|nr:gliding motility lipoprotein GldH [Microscilla marina]
MERITRNQVRTNLIVGETENTEKTNNLTKQRWGFLCGLLLCIIGLNACDSSRIFEQNVDIVQSKWYKDSVLKFTFEITDTLSRYKFYYNIRNTVSYPFYNMYVTYYLVDSLDRRIASDLQNIDLMHPKTGKPYGDGLGDIFSHQLLALSNVKFLKRGKYTFKIKHYMRRDPLPEVVSMGLRIEKVPPLK